MKVISSIMEKGGSGKTTLAANLAIGLAMRGYRVLIIDTDRQADMTGYLGLTKEPHFYDFCKRSKTQLRELIQVVPETVVGSDVFQRVYCVAGNGETEGVPSGMRITDLATAIGRRLSALRDIFDYVIFDTPPTPSMIHDALTMVSDYILMVVDPEPFCAYNGLPSTIAHTQHYRNQLQKEGFDRARILGIVPNKFRTGTRLHKEILDNLKKTYGDLVWEPVKLAVALSEAQLIRRFLQTDAPELKSTKTIDRFVNRAIKELENAQAS